MHLEANAMTPGFFKEKSLYCTVIQPGSQVLKGAQICLPVGWWGRERGGGGVWVLCTDVSCPTVWGRFGACDTKRSLTEWAGFFCMCPFLKSLFQILLDWILEVFPEFMSACAQALADFSSLFFFSLRHKSIKANEPSSAPISRSLEMGLRLPVCSWFIRTMWSRAETWAAIAVQWCWAGKKGWFLRSFISCLGLLQSYHCFRQIISVASVFYLF